MSFLVAAPDTLAASASDLAGIGSSLSEANVAATASTTRLIAAGGDEVSAAIASLFSRHGKAFQALSAQAAAFHDQFVQALRAGAGAYASTETTNTSPMLQQVLKGGQVAQLASWGQTLENLPALSGQFVRTAAAGINQWANNIVTNIFGTPATPAIPATQNPSFHGHSVAGNPHRGWRAPGVPETFRKPLRVRHRPSTVVGIAVCQQLSATHLDGATRRNRAAVNV